MGPSFDQDWFTSIYFSLVKCILDVLLFHFYYTLDTFSYCLLVICFTINFFRKSLGFFFLILFTKLFLKVFQTVWFHDTLCASHLINTSNKIASQVQLQKSVNISFTKAITAFSWLFIQCCFDIFYNQWLTSWFKNNLKTFYDAHLKFSQLSHDLHKPWFITKTQLFF